MTLERAFSRCNIRCCIASTLGSELIVPWVYVPGSKPIRRPPCPANGLNFGTKVESWLLPQSSLGLGLPLWLSFGHLRLSWVGCLVERLELASGELRGNPASTPHIVGTDGGLFWCLLHSALSSMTPTLDPSTSRGSSGHGVSDQSPQAPDPALPPNRLAKTKICLIPIL